nr:PREDICTED: uncharacterized protein LOC105668620 [Linepithema humile]
MATQIVNLPQLDAKNFNNWKFTLQTLLAERQVLDNLEKTVDDFREEKAKKEFEIRDFAKAKSTIVQYISDKHLDLIKEAKTAKEMISLLEKVFERKSIFKEEEDNDTLEEEEELYETPTTLPPVKEETRTTKLERKVNKPKHLDEYETYIAYCLLTNDQDPQLYEDAVKDDEWKRAIKKELKSHQTNGTPIRGIVRKIYFCFSFGFLLARTTAVSLYAASVHDESLLPAPVLYSVSGSSYSSEVSRFLTQVTTDNISLTGMKFFSVTRSLVLTVAGTIVTYELVLVQFNSV